MSNDNDRSTEVDEENVNLFGDGFEDSSLVDTPEGNEPEAEGTEGAAPVEPEGEQLPDKYRGKSITDVIDMHRNLEQAYGRHNNELGELRQLTDQILKQQLGESKATEQTELDSDALLDDPKSAINGAVESNPKVVELEARLNARERADNLQAFNRAHPKAKDTVNDPRFLAWVEESPTRVRLLQQANQSYDYELAGEILSNYATLHPVAEADAKRGETKAAMGNAKPSAAGGGRKAKIFKRADVMRLKIEDPKRYEKLQPQIQAAYAEGRVR